MRQMRAAGKEADAAFLANQKLNFMNSGVHGFSKARLKALALSLIQTGAKVLSIKLLSVFQQALFGHSRFLTPNRA